MREPRKTSKASASLSVDRDGAPGGMRKRGMPKGQSATRASLSPISTKSGFRKSRITLPSAMNAGE